MPKPQYIGMKKSRTISDEPIALRVENGLAFVKILGTVYSR
jgi:hypothetical protein